MVLQKRIEVGRADQKEGEFLCIATFLPVKRWRDVIPFMRMSSQVEKQLKETPGLARYSLRVNLFRKRFWTFSVWGNRASTNAFVHASPHTIAVERFQEWAGEGAAFVEWSSSDGSINWKEAMRRLQTPTFYYKPTSK
jgi:hypothetical protein